MNIDHLDAALALLRKKFDFILIDAGAASRSPFGLALARKANRVRLVIELAMKSAMFAAVLLPLSASWSLAQTNAGDVGSAPDRFILHNWAQIRPDFAYLNGCATGYRAFTFGRDGYFVFNRNVHGVWRVTDQNNLILRTKNGQIITLFIANSTLAYASRNVAQVPQTDAPVSPGETVPTPHAANARSARSIIPGLPIAPPVASSPPGGAVQTEPTGRTNPPYESVASGYLHFRAGDLFQECGH